MVDAEEISRFITVAFLIDIGLGVGTSTTFDDFHKAFAKPKAVFIGFCSQYLFMPIAAYLITLAFRLEKEYAIGAVIVGCAPGGSSSNLFTYWSKGNVALSITMSFMSTVAAFGLMPFWIWVLVKMALGSTATIDWFNLIVIIFFIVVPTFLGLAIRKHNTVKKVGRKFYWEWIELSATLFGAIFLVAVLVNVIIIYGNILNDASYKVWIMCVVMQPLACAFGYFAAKFCGMPSRDVCAISLETGVQNFALVVAVIQISFSDDDVRKKVLTFPICFGFLYLAWSPLIVLFFRYCIASTDKESADEGSLSKSNSDKENSFLGDEELDNEFKEKEDV